MKKLFTICAAMLLALTASAHVVNITPTSPRESKNIYYALRDSTTADTIRLAAGTYVESSSIAANRNIVIIAADGAAPVVQLGSDKYIAVTNSAKVVIKGLKFDGFAESTPTVQYAIRPNDASATEIRVENCEFYGFLKNIITCGETNHADSLILNNCYFHNNNGRAAVYFPACTVENQQTIFGVKIMNSTFANNNLANDYVGMIDVRSNGLTATDDIEVIVDHCTFYNNTTKNTDYADVNTRIANRSIVSNCIFAHPVAYDRRATFMYQGSVVNNCITYNLTKDASQDGHTWMSTRTNTSTIDPLFTDSANGDFSLKGNWVTMELSPARSAATDGSNLGDPRWVAAEILPDVDFATPYQFIGTKAILAGEIGLDANNHIEYYDTNAKGTATWKIHATRACELIATLNMNEASTSGHQFKIEVLAEDGTGLAEISEPNQVSDAGDIELTDHVAIPAEGNYIIRLYNLTPWSAAVINGVTFAEAPAPAGCNWDAIGWLGDGSAEQTFANQFKLCVGDPAPTNVATANIQTPGFATASGIYLTFPSAGFSEFSLDASQYDIQGAGIIFHVAAFTAKETEVSLKVDGTLYTFTIYNDKGSDVPTAIENNSVVEKAQKFIENGQLFIIKNGVRYNAQGAVVK